jgi:LmbE family N-acetylglucosaminyl deacetylase
MRLASIEAIRQKYDHVYVSPHMDDVGLACAGRIAAQRRVGEAVLVVTVFTGDIPEEEKVKHKLFGQFLNTDNRKREDQTAMDLLDVDYLWLDHLERLLRLKQRTVARWRFFAPLSDEDKQLCQDLAAQITRICQMAHAQSLYLPLGIGQHLDHRVVSEIGHHCQPVLGEQIALRFYEDVPYVFVANVLKHRLRTLNATCDPKRLTRDLAQEKSFVQEALETCRSVSHLHFLAIQLKNPIAKAILWLGLLVVLANSRARKDLDDRAALMLSPELCDISPEVEKKIEVVNAYRSQVDLLFGDLDRFKAHLAEYSLTIGAADGQYLERYWSVKPEA